MSAPIAVDTAVALDIPFPTSFHFRVGIGGQLGGADSSFLEVSGMGPEMETESVAEGGENRFTYQLPKAMKHPKLALKRGIATLQSPLLVWCKEVLEGDMTVPIQTKLINVKLLDAAGNPLRSWSFANAYPVHWAVEGFNAMKNEVAVEKIELVYSYSQREV